MQTYPPELKKLLDACNIPVAALLSLTIQVLLILLGNCRKNNSKPWIRFVLWSTYLGADAVAAFALGAISNKLLDLYDDEKNAGCDMDVKTELAAFWAPFLLLHMGGPDTITAYALEDNQLWLRQLLTLAGSAVGAGNIFLMAFTSSSSLSFLSIPMLLAGVIKCGERIYSLRSASTDQLKDSLFIDEDKINPSSEVSVFKNELERKSNAGYAVAEERCINGSFPKVDFSVMIDNSNIPEQNKVLTAYELLYITKRVFLDSTLTTKSKEIVQTVYRNLSFEDAFLIIDIELGLMFELFYTKLPSLCTLWGSALRLITFFINCLTFILFFFAAFLVRRKKYEILDISITFILIVAAIILEIYSALLILSSDRFLAKSSTVGRKTSILQAIKRNPSPNPRWSNNISQLSIVTLLYNPTPLPCSHILQHSWIDDKKWEKLWYSPQKQVPDRLKQLIFRYFKNRAAQTSTDKSQQSLKDMNNYFSEEFERDKLLDFAEDLGKTILFWHTVTEVAYYCCLEEIQKKDAAILAHCELINDLSRYMLYLLLLQPSVLTIDGIDPMSFQRTVNEYRNRLTKEEANNRILACEKLIQPAKEGATNRIFDKLFEEAFAFAAKIKRKYSETNSLERFNFLGGIWLKLMEYAARNSKGGEHAKLLIDGGEFFSHVWLLMTHFGLTDHFQISETSEAIGFVAI